MSVQPPKGSAWEAVVKGSTPQVEEIPALIEDAVRGWTRNPEAEVPWPCTEVEGETCTHMWCVPPLPPSDYTPQPLSWLEGQS